MTATTIATASTPHSPAVALSCEHCHSDQLILENPPRPNPRYDLFRCRACRWLQAVWRAEVAA